MHRQGVAGQIDAGRGDRTKLTRDVHSRKKRSEG